MTIGDIDQNEPGRREAVRRRDRAADGQFYYAVITTGVYCRPSCGARAARPENLRFFATAEEARLAGFRPCKRCRPDDSGFAARQAEIVAAACRLIDTSDEIPSLTALADAAGLSRFHFHRLFKAAIGLTPKDYAAAARAERLRRDLPRGKTVTAALYDAGFSSSGRFYEATPAALGMTPGHFRGGGAGTTIRYAVGGCSLGRILVAATARGVCAVALGDADEPLVRELRKRFAKAELVGGDPAFAALVDQVVSLVETPSLALSLPLDLAGTAFQHRVWAALRDIPAGRTESYAQLARRLGMPKAARAVAGACAANPAAVVVPCHRVVRSDGALAGYRWGIERKRRLLGRERS
jgi:AraC family transcriptional regulator of adaptative response/methylated-DNA-[protein]-cysteine methyltransferase